ncbi:hypothetical protein ZWY2020_045484 [Hordeum vulgare]|nr:hypothetical protein ZWY2020_045484 [Hordeum vulgare]
MHSSMSGSAAGGQGPGVVGLFYGGHPPAADGDDDVFFQSHSASGGGGDDGGVTPSAYSSITDYLQGLLDPAELARQLDAPAPPCFPTAAEVIGAEPAPFTPNSSTSGEAAECRRQPGAGGGRRGGIGRSWQLQERREGAEEEGEGEKKAAWLRVALATKAKSTTSAARLQLGA